MRKTFVGLFTFVVLISQVSYATENVVQVDALNLKLKAVGAGWVAKDTELSGLTKIEAKRMMGLRRTKGPDVEFMDPAPMKTLSNMPSSIDWRNKDGKNWISPILNQANCGSCVAFAAIGVMETQYNIAAALPSLNVKLSPQNLFACGGGMCDWGWMPGPAANFLQKTGVTDEACMPYMSGATGQDVKCSAACADSAQRTIRISSYDTPTRSVTDIEAVKQALQKGPVVTTLSVYADFMAYGSGVYKHVSGDELGGHAISIVGYDDASQSFIIRNSWGKTWGEDGFGHVAYSDISGVGDDTWSYEIPSPAGAVSVESPRDYSYFTAHAPWNSVSTFAGTSVQSATAYDKSGKAMWTGNCSTASCAQDIDVSGWVDGRYEMTISAMNSVGSVLGVSSRQFFYVANSKPVLGVSFAGASGTDLSKDVSGRIVFAITTSSSSVPMSSLEFHSRGPDGKERVSTASIVLNQMTMGWRTNLVPNGDYDVWMVGHVKTNGMVASVESAHRTVHTKN
jgi:C1A family cysteine protease